VSTTALPVGSPQVLSPSNSELYRWHRELTRAAQVYTHAVWTIAYYGFKMRLAGGWREFQCENEEEYRNKLNVPRSTWYLYIGIVQNLPHVDLEDLKKIPPTNAQMMGLIPPHIRHEFPWVEEAKSLPPADFAKKVTERSLAVGEHREPLTFTRFKVEYSAKEAIEECVKDFQKRHNIASPGRALEFLVAERFTGDDNTLAKIEQARTVFKAMEQELVNRAILDPVMVNFLSDLGRLLNEVCEETTQAIRERGRRPNGRARADGDDAERSREAGLQEPAVSAMEEAEWQVPRVP